MKAEGLFVICGVVVAFRLKVCGERACHRRPSGHRVGYDPYAQRPDCPQDCRPCRTSHRRFRPAERWFLFPNRCRRCFAGCGGIPQTNHAAQEHQGQLCAGRHHGLYCQYASPDSKSTAASNLDVVVLGATEIDTESCESLHCKLTAQWRLVFGIRTVWWLRS